MGPHGVEDGGVLRQPAHWLHTVAVTMREFQSMRICKPLLGVGTLRFTAQTTINFKNPTEAQAEGSVIKAFRGAATVKTKALIACYFG